MRSLVFGLILVFTGASSLASAETVTLKSGKVVEGEIVEKTKEYLKVDTGSRVVKIPFKMIDPSEVEALRKLPNPNKPISSGRRSSGSRSAEGTPEEIFKHVSPSVVYILNRTQNGEEKLGSGFIVDASGVIVTNYHVFQDAQGSFCPAQRWRRLSCGRSD